MCFAVARPMAQTVRLNFLRNLVVVEASILDHRVVMDPILIAALIRSVTIVACLVVVLNASQKDSGSLQLVD